VGLDALFAANFENERSLYERELDVSQGSSVAPRSVPNNGIFAAPSVRISKRYIWLDFL
jgi:hypothetical protein